MCAISIICLAVVLVLVLVLKDSLRTYFKSLSWSLGVRSLSLSLGVRSRRFLFLSWSLGVRSLSWSLGVRSLSLSWSLGVRSLLTSLIKRQLVIYIVTWTAFPYLTLHRQPIPITGKAVTYAVLCGVINCVPPKLFEVRLTVSPFEHLKSTLLFCSRAPNNWNARGVFSLLSEIAVASSLSSTLLFFLEFDFVCQRFI